jgi:hypothetical protein
MKNFLSKIVMGFTVVVLFFLAGCIGATDLEGDSDIPWNTPQQWEGSRSIPGMSPGY